MRFIYSTILYLLTPFVLLRLFWLGFKNPAYWSRCSERFGLISDYPGASPVIWVHAVSVGEVQAATPLLTELLSMHHQYQIIITTVTPTGADMIKRKFGDTVMHFYLPYDLPHAVAIFIRKIKPKLLIVMETELWPNLYSHCYQLGIPVLLINARMSSRSFTGYKRISKLTRQALLNVNIIAAQSNKDSARFIALGADPSQVVTMGNLKFDVNIPQSIEEEAQSMRRYFSVNRPVWIAASTHEGEDELVLNAHSLILQTYQSCLLILAPRHPERFTSVASLCTKNGFNTISKSKTNEYASDTQVFVLDTLGELPVYYAASDIAFVGGSLLPFGGHNVLEPASLGIPVITGMHTHNFVEINQLLLEKGAEFQVSDAKELATKVELLLSDGNLRHKMGQYGREIVEQNKGSTKRVMEIITKILSVCVDAA